MVEKVKSYETGSFVPRRGKEVGEEEEDDEQDPSFHHDLDLLYTFRYLLNQLAPISTKHEILSRWLLRSNEVTVYTVTTVTTTEGEWVKPYTLSKAPFVRRSKKR